MTSTVCNSRNIPLPVQREIRQRCGFGCVICGMPLYEYEHMEEWAVVQRHVADEITLLCDQHHREKTAGCFPRTLCVLLTKNLKILKAAFQNHTTSTSPENALR